MSAKRSVKENLSYLRRGYGLIWKLAPNLLLRDGVRRLAEALQTALAVYFSALIIEALTGGAELKILAGLIALTIGVTFGLSVLIDALKSANTADEELMYNKIQLYLGKASLDFAFEDIENPQTRILRNRVDEAMKARRGGLDMMYRRGGNTFGKFCAVVVSGVLAAPLFTSVSSWKIDSFVGFFNTPYASILLLTAILALSLTAGRSFQIAASKLFEAWKGWPRA